MEPSFGTAARKVERGERLDPRDLGALLGHFNLPELGLLAQQARNRAQPGSTVTYVWGGCWSLAPDGDSGDRARDGLLKRAIDLARCGGGEICLAYTPAAAPSLDECVSLLADLRSAGNALTLSLPVGVLRNLAGGASADLALERLASAGLSLVRGERVAGGPALDFRDWLETMRAVHQAGVPCTAAVSPAGSGAGEQADQWEAIRRLQDETGLFISASAGPIGGRGTGDPMRPAAESASSFQYLRTLSAARCFLDNIPHFQASWEAQGTKIAEVALRSGADDFGATGLNPESRSSPGLLLPPEEIERLIRDSGFQPRVQDGLFRALPAAGFVGSAFALPVLS